MENNKEIKSWGEKPQFDFEPKHHVDIAENLGIIDYKRGAKLGGNGFWIYRKDGAIIKKKYLNKEITPKEFEKWIESTKKWNTADKFKQNLSAV